MQPVFTFRNGDISDPISMRGFNAREAGIAVGNYGNHELGHRYGLNHVSAAGYIMTERSIPSYTRHPWSFNSSIQLH